MTIKDAKPIVQLRHGESTQATVMDSMFFKYVIEENTSELEHLLLLLNLSKRKDLQVYIHHAAYPSIAINEHDYSLGDLPDNILRSMFKNYYMREALNDSNPF